QVGWLNTTTGCRFAFRVSRARYARYKIVDVGFIRGEHSAFHSHRHAIPRDADRLLQNTNRRTLLNESKTGEIAQRSSQRINHATQNQQNQQGNQDRHKRASAKSSHRRFPFESRRNVRPQIGVLGDAAAGEGFQRVFHAFVVHFSLLSASTLRNRSRAAFNNHLIVPAAVPDSFAISASLISKKYLWTITALWRGDNFCMASQI